MGGHRPMPQGKFSLHFAAKALPASVRGSNIRPFLVVLLHDTISRKLKVLGSTRPVTDQTTAPVWTESIEVDYFFERDQPLYIDLFHQRAAKSTRLKDQCFLGRAKVRVSELAVAGGHALTAPFDPSEGPSASALHSKALGQLGTLTVVGEELAVGSSGKLSVQLGVCSLPKMDFWGAADPYLTIERQREDGEWTRVFESTVVKNRSKCWWPKQVLSLRELVNNDDHRPIRFAVWDWNRRSPDEQIGMYATSVRELLDAQARSGSPLLYFKFSPGKARKPGSACGGLCLRGLRLIEEPQFLEYLEGGLQIQVMVGVDFTASNGNVTDPTSLHYAESRQPNQYQRALRRALEILAPYDSDQKIPAFGFGGRDPHTARVSHTLPLSLDPEREELSGVAGVLDAYAHAITQVRLSGPTLFAPLLTRALEEAREIGDNGYVFLLLLTDGEINDMPQTVDCIVEAANGLPLSVVIVGIGDRTDFRKMDMLDADDAPLCSRKGEHAKRDIVQFVPFHQFLRRSDDEFAASVLEEIPKQVVTYFRMQGIKPHPPRSRQHTASMRSIAPSQGVMRRDASAPSSAVPGGPTSLPEGTPAATAGPYRASNSASQRGPPPGYTP